MIKNTILVLVAIMGFLVPAKADNTSTNLPANTITVSAIVNKKDIVVIHADKLWINHISGELPTNIKINNNEWNPNWEDRESDTYIMKKPPRFLPMNNRRGLLSVSLAQTNAVVKVIEYPDYSNEWILMVALTVKSEKPMQLDLTISWENDPIPIVLPTYEVPTTKPNPTPTGLI